VSVLIRTRHQPAAFRGIWPDANPINQQSKGSYMTNASVLAVQEAVAALNKAMVSGDRTELIYRHAGGRTADKQQFIDDAARGSLKITDAVISDQTVTLIDNIALVDHVLKRFPRIPKHDNDVSTLQVLGVWMFRNNQWKVIARQSFRLKGA
jgi:hypothetical protein